ncbi:shikimate dehydrogenase family protein [Bradyrhizobium brasilense]|uniref:shikimate dehydrogenase (NADP(+)) n=1 Tax=Bradyrhizobium brasilense TaxID=1419277 RepID=A0ABY8JEX8_9BRAD|nr:shikimate dehydrogenase [Bradyrhizobium brasilense]WFU62553.1 shikimate dehydrogenase [Bradyrhizobium brasilense]
MSANLIDGSSKVYGIIGDPIAQIRTPEAMNKIIAERRRQAVFVPFHVHAGNLRTFVAGIKAWQNLPGFTLTVPHKEAILALCDHLGPMAKITGSVNVVRRRADGTWEGETYDGLGFVAGMKSQGIDPAGAKIHLQGSGGAAKAIAAALAETGAARVDVANRSQPRAVALINRLNASYSGRCVFGIAADLATADVVINATSLGLHENDPLPIDVSALSSRQIVAEVIMQPHTTALLREARARGCRIHQGIHMLTGQIVEIANFLEI